MNLDALLTDMIARGASDLHLKAGQPPTLRVNGELERTALPPVSAEEMETLTAEMLTPEQLDTLRSRSDVDFSFGVRGKGRFRVNFCRQRGTVAGSFRRIAIVIPEIDSLQLPPKLSELALERRGLLLVTGTVGSGKSTTLAAMLGLVNRRRRAKIVTVEDPVEFLHNDDGCQVVQREVGTDTPSFAEALRHALRQDPDVIMVGEIRDSDSMNIALTAANTGHLVLSTLHTIDAAQTMNRVVSFFPPHQAGDIRHLLASCLLAVVSQRLVPRADGAGRVPAVELLVATAAVRECLVDSDKVPQLSGLIAEGAQYGMQTFDQSLLRLCQQGVITPEVALLHATRPTDFELSLQGIQGASGPAWS